MPECLSKGLHLKSSFPSVKYGFSLTDSSVQQIDFPDSRTVGKLIVPMQLFRDPFKFEVLYVVWLCSVECAEPPGQLYELEFFHCGVSDYRVCLSSVEIRLAGFGRCSVLQFVAGDTWLNKIRRVLFLCQGRAGAGMEFSYVQALIGHFGYSELCYILLLFRS